MQEVVDITIEQAAVVHSRSPLRPASCLPPPSEALELSKNSAQASQGDERALA